MRMFQHVAEYDAVYLAKFPCFEEDLGPALAWAVDRAGQLASGITVVAPTMERFGDGVLAKLPASISRESPRTLAKSGHRAQPVVVACWPSAQDLDMLDGSPGLKALVAVPWNEEEISTWRDARRAVDLLGHQPAGPEPAISDAVVEMALTDITTRVNLSTGLGHPDDKAAAIQAFQILKRSGCRFQPQEIRTWAMANGWQAEDARKLGEYAAGVLAGKAYQTGRKQWVPDVMDRWRKEAAAKS
jgi:hypothetical protein